MGTSGFQTHDLKPRPVPNAAAVVVLPPVESDMAMSEPSKGLCVKHLWGAPPGKDNLPCPYCLGILCSRLGVIENGEPKPRRSNAMNGKRYMRGSPDWKLTCAKRRRECSCSRR